MATILNVAGLSVAFAGFIVILMQIAYERNFDNVHPTSKRVFRIDLQVGDTYTAIIPRAVVEDIIQSSPHIEAGGLLNPFLNPVYFTYTENGEKHGIREALQTCLPGLVKVFDFPFIEGDGNCLSEPDKMIIPESLARRLFGSSSAIGKTLHAEAYIWSKDRADLTVGAVYRDFPENTQLKNLIYTAINPQYARNDYVSGNYISYLLLDDPSYAQEVADQFSKSFDFAITQRQADHIKLTPITDIYYQNESQDGLLFRSGNKEMTMLLFLIAILIVAVAFINYINFSTALAPVRIKSINTRKVLGSSTDALRNSLLMEAVSISVVAWIVSLGMVWAVGRFASLPLINADLSFASYPCIIILSGVIAIIVGFLAGLYPSYYMVSFPPALVLKGSFGVSPTGRKLRTALISIQFIVSIILIIGACMIQVQNSFMQSFSLGFDKDRIAVVELSGDFYQNQKDTYVNRLKEYPGIEGVAFASEKIGSKDGYSTYADYYHEQRFEFFLFSVSSNFFDVMGIPVIGGRSFSKSDEESGEASYIFNKTVYQSMDMHAGEKFGKWLPGKIVGWIDNVKFTSLRRGDNNIGFVNGDNLHSRVGSMSFSYIRLAAGVDMPGAVAHIQKTLTDLAPTYPFDIEFYDTIFHQLYQKETNLRTMITLFSLLAIVLSLVGVFGLVVFETQYRRKEIAVRKVHGATTQEILGMLNKHYAMIVLICFLVATPIVWKFTQIWLSGFAYRAPVHWWIFVLAFIAVLSVTFATVTFQSWRTATSNPVDSLKSE